MSNDEATIVEDSERSCVEVARASGVELLMSRDVPLGGPRAMPVQRVLPNKFRHFIGAWCFADAFGPTDISDGPGMDVPPHPHTGLQTWSWLIDGAIEHRDSTGGRHTVRPGGVNLMTAGHGIAHSEYSTPDTRVLHGVQLWTVLPAAEREREPSFEGHDAVPEVVIGEGASAGVFVGSFAGATSAVPAFTPLVGAEVRLAAGASAELPLRPDFEHGVLAVTDGLVVNGVTVPRGSLAYFPPGSGGVTVAARDGAIAIVIGGEPFEEEIVMFWNFVGTNHAIVAAAREEWMRERDADPAARSRFGTVVDDGNLTLPSPRIPDVELLPRGRAKRRSAT